MGIADVMARRVEICMYETRRSNMQMLRLKLYSRELVEQGNGVGIVVRREMERKCT